jgi:predicted transposase/invertase (TIGR01784 family)
MPPNKSTELEDIEVVLRYLTASVDSSKMADLKRAVITFIETGGKLMPTIAEKWLLEGEAKGIKKGKIQDAQKMIAKEMSTADIHEITGLSIQKIDSLRIKAKKG